MESHGGHLLPKLGVPCPLPDCTPHFPAVHPARSGDRSLPWDAEGGFQDE